jgi:localization factor PodJL
VLYAEGVDGKPDYANAVTWFRKAAEHGVSDSQYNLGVLYARGIGTAKNLEESYEWFALAAAQGDKESGKKRDEIASHLDAKELAAARHAVESFKALPQPDAAIAVPAPADGWGKPSVPVKSQAQPAGPLSLGSFTVGNR